MKINKQVMKWSEFKFENKSGFLNQFMRLNFQIQLLQPCNRSDHSSDASIGENSEQQSAENGDLGVGGGLGTRDLDEDSRKRL